MMTMEAAERLSRALSDRYRIERELGQGGMATVYLAHDVRQNRKVALKVLRPELAAILGGTGTRTQFTSTDFSVRSNWSGRTPTCAPHPAASTTW